MEHYQIFFLNIVIWPTFVILWILTDNQFALFGAGIMTGMLLGSALRGTKEVPS